MERRGIILVWVDRKKVLSTKEDISGVSATIGIGMKW